MSPATRSAFAHRLKAIDYIAASLGSSNGTIRDLRGVVPQRPRGDVAGRGVVRSHAALVANSDGRSGTVHTIIGHMAGVVEVPDLVGMAFHDARDLVAGMGTALANPDPDGPPIGAVAWPGLFFITTQIPSPGSTINRGESIRVTVVKDQYGAV